MKLRKVLALAAAAVMAVAALASCGVKEDSSNDSKAGGSSETVSYTHLTLPTILLV